MDNISLKVRILDKDYQVNCQPAEREVLENSAQILNDKMEDIRRSSNIIGVERIAVMAALNLTHDLLRAEDTAKQDAGASQVLEAIDSKLDSVLFDLDRK
ncbi:MAG: cell division protein ZapA [Porticoccaceae bacterium]|nr:cell division protein ZapA [Porticoccaceae bacterium]